MFSIKFLSEELNQLLKNIQANFPFDLKQINDVDIESSLQKIPRRTWKGPINSTKLYHIVSPNHKLNSSINLTDEKLLEVKDFLLKSAGYYGGYVLEFFNLINNLNSKMDIMAKLSFVRWTIPDYNILEGLFTLMENLGYICY